MKNKKGLSGIVTTLIIILLVLVAAGVIATVVNNFLDKTSGSADVALKCTDIEVRATKVVQQSTTVYNVTLNRKPRGEGEVGAKIVFFSDTSNSEPMPFGEMLSPLETSTKTITLVDALNATMVSVTPYFLDDSNRERLCEGTYEFKFE
ncbi:MAG: hypothetical protein PF542_04340 [Nanoarchaeota archaeon]|jgi:flagellin-like protein|nr:hypothetical protein [Nanoarchaeota archaeon]